ncbi:MAG: hypothetical protein MR678_11740 [Muribaculaceae bacterium]|nr:hypothetical protein [Muribaculaceae bacterium]
MSWLSPQATASTESPILLATQVLLPGNGRTPEKSHTVSPGSPIGIESACTIVARPTSSIALLPAAVMTTTTAARMQSSD